MGGLPPIADWVVTMKSMLFGGLDMKREPLDVVVTSNSSTPGTGGTPGPCQLGMIRVLKGFTRASCIALVALVASELDLSAASTMQLLEPLSSFLDVAWMLPMTAPPPLVAHCPGSAFDERP